MAAKSKLKKLLLCTVLAFVLTLSNFCGLTAGLVSMFAKAEYKSTDFKSYDFESSSGWSTNTNYETKDSEKPFDGTSSRYDLITSNAENKIRPATKYDGVSTLLTGNERDANSGDFAMLINAKDAPSKQSQVKKDKNGNIVYDTSKFVSYATKEEATTGGYEAEQNGAVWVRIFADSQIDKNNMDAYLPITSGEHEGKYKKYVEQYEDLDIYYGYKSSSISLSSNSYYVANFWAYTSSDVAATLIIKGTGYNATVTIDTNGTWKFYSLFLASKGDNSTSVNIYYYLGTDKKISDNTSVTGFVVLDDVNIKSINQTDYNNKTVDGEAVGTVEKLNNILSKNKIDGYTYTALDYISLQYTPKTFVNGVISNNDFESGNIIISESYRKDTNFENESLTKWTKYIPKYTSDSNTTNLPKAKYDEYVAAYSSMLEESIVEENIEFESKEGEADGKSTFNTNNHVMKLVNKSASLLLGYTTNAFVIPQLGYYKVSLFLKATDEKAKATVKMFSEIQVGTGPKLIIKSQEIEPYQKTSDDTNNWMEVSFYVRGNALRENKVYLTILAGAESTIYVDNINVEKVSSSVYSNATSSKRLDVALSSSMPSTGVSNGYFTEISTTDETDTWEAPYKASSWTLDTENNTDSIISGIIPTSDTNYTPDLKTKLGNIANPNTTCAKTNVYAIYAPDADSTFKMTSSSFSLSSSTVYKLFFSVYAGNNIGADSTMTVKLLFGDKSHLLEVKQELKSSPSNWILYSTYLRTDDTSRSLKLEFSFNKLQGTTFIKDIRHVTISDIKESDNKTIKKSANDQFVEAMNNHMPYEYFVDFRSESFTEYGKESETVGLYNSLNYTLEKLDENSETVQGKVGIIFTTVDFNADGNGTITSSELTPAENKSQKVLIISNKESAMVSRISPIVDHTLSKNSYYKLTFKIKTNELEENKGLTIRLSSLGIVIENVDTTKDVAKNGEDGYRVYEVYVRTGEDTIASTYVGFELKGKGYALISDINMTKIDDQEAYDKAIENVTADSEHYLLSYYTEDTKNDEDTKDDRSSSSVLAIFFYVLSSLLLVAAMVVAMVAIFIKKHPIKKAVVVENKAEITQYKDGKPISKRKAKNDNGKGGFV